MNSWKPWMLVAAWLAAGSLGCGGGDTPQPTGPALSGAATSATVSEGDTEVNQPPRIVGLRFEPSEPTIGNDVRAIVEASDPDGDPIQLGFVWRINQRGLAASGDNVSLIKTAKGDSIEVTVTASDGKAESAARSLSATLPNRRPLLRRAWLGPSESVVPGTTLSAFYDATDLDGDDLEVEVDWVVNDRHVWEKDDERDFSTAELRRGDRVKAIVTVNDGVDEETQETEERILENSLPVIVSRPAAAEPNEQFRYAVQAEDPDGDRSFRFRLVNAPRGMELDPVSGEITWRPGPDHAGRHAVEISVDDRHGGVTTQRFVMNVAEDAAATSPAAVR